MEKNKKYTDIRCAGLAILSLAFLVACGQIRNTPVVLPALTPTPFHLRLPPGEIDTFTPILSTKDIIKGKKIDTKVKYPAFVPQIENNGISLFQGDQENKLVIQIQKESYTNTLGTRDYDRIRLQIDLFNNLKGEGTISRQTFEEIMKQEDSETMTFLISPQNGEEPYRPNVLTIFQAINVGREPTPYSLIMQIDAIRQQTIGAQSRGIIVGSLGLTAIKEN
ncbi:MAG: hypothetical protein Q7S61_06445 [bacterium]|nr:hypothetical protein [bacterium]